MNMCSKLRKIEYPLPWKKVSKSGVESEMGSLEFKQRSLKIAKRLIFHYFLCIFEGLCGDLKSTPIYLKFGMVSILT